MDNILLMPAKGAEFPNHNSHILTQRSSTIITSQLPIEHWHAWIGNATIADAILDRLMQRNHRFNLTGESLRGKAQSVKSDKSDATATSCM